MRAGPSPGVYLGWSPPVLTPFYPQGLPLHAQTAAFQPQPSPAPARGRGRGEEQEPFHCPRPRGGELRAAAPPGREPLSQHTQPRRRTLPAVALKDRSHIPHRAPRPPQPPLTPPHPPLPRGSRTQPAWCGVTLPCHPHPGHQTVKPSWGNTVAPVVFGERGQGGIEGWEGHKVLPASPGWIVSCTPGWKRRPPMAASASKGAEPGRGPALPGMCAHGTATTHGSARSEGQHQPDTAELALRLYWCATYTLGGTKRAPEWGWNATALWAGRGTRVRAGS